MVFVWVTLVPFLAVLDRARTLGRAVGLGLLLSVGFVFAVLNWFAGAMADYTGTSHATGILLLLVLAPFLQPQFIVFAAVRHLVRTKAAFWHAALASAFSYVAAEWVFPKLFADTLGHSMFAFTWLRQAADIAGAQGLTFVVVLVNLCIWETIRRVRERGLAARTLTPVSCALLLVSSIATYGVVRAGQFSPDRAAGDLRAAPIRAGVVQADIAHYDRMRAEIGTYESVRRILDAHYRLSEQAMSMSNGLDLLVWPETVYPTTFGAPKSEDGAAFDREIERFVTRSGVPLVFGSYDAEAGSEFNAAVFLEPQTAETGHMETGLGPERGVDAPGRRPHPAHRAVDLFRRRRSGSGSRCGCARSGSHRHPFERFLVRVRRWALAAPRRVGVSQHRGAPAAGSRDQHRDLRRHHAHG